MQRPILRHQDGFARTTPHLKDDVRVLQRALRDAGHPVDVDGCFGDGTRDAVVAFQTANGLSADGIVGPNTWAALAPPAESAGDDVLVAELLPGFRGQLSWVHAREGHAGRPYWPGGASGVTLDPGIDLGYAEPDLVERLYGPLLTAEQLAAVRGVFGVRGTAARDALDGDPALQSIRLSRHQSERLFPYGAQPYWSAITRRFPGLPAPDAPGAVHTALLSLAYNRGPGNPGLAPLEEPLAQRDWQRLADLIAGMQQDHQLAGIRKRRRLEADLIRAHIA